MVPSALHVRAHFLGGLMVLKVYSTLLISNDSEAFSSYSHQSSDKSVTAAFPPRPAVSTRSGLILSLSACTKEGCESGSKPAGARRRARDHRAPTSVNRAPSVLSQLYPPWSHAATRQRHTTSKCSPLHGEVQSLVARG
jgi:hypothetical protein